MAKSILVYGESGAGKTTSLRNLNAAETCYIDADGKGMSWGGWRKQYNKENKNYLKTTNPSTIAKCLSKISESVPNVKNIIIDTINGIMVSDEMNRMKEHGYDKWQDLAFSVWNLIELSNRGLRDDLNVIFIGHSQTERDESGYFFTRLKTNGKKLEKIVLESKFTTVLYAKCVDGKYIFETKARNSTAKTPMGAFESDEIDNDMDFVLKQLEAF
jgi:adenylate kinase family enzyme